MKEPRLYVQGDVMLETTSDYRGWIRVDLRVGSKMAATITLQVDDSGDVDGAIDMACRALAVELKREYRK